MIYKEVKPSKKLSSLIQSYWFFKASLTEYAESFEHTVMADGCTSLVLVLPSQYSEPVQIFSGPTTKNDVVQVIPGVTYLGIRFNPSAVHAIFGIEGIQLRDSKLLATDYLKSLDTSSLLNDNEADTLFMDLNKILESFLEKIELNKNSIILETAQIILKAHGKVRISDITNSSRMSTRHLQKEFKRLSGLTLKEFSRIRRIRTSVIQIMLREQDKKDVIYNSGFYDLPHFNNEFLLIVENTPTAFKKYIDTIKHIDVNP